MRLKKIDVVGFKSFADKISLPFSTGITAVVGPNGCGKSNIADAIRWVLGEQSAKSMRGIKMGDIIFAGTTTRKALNYAEVTITFTDVDGELPIEYDEVAVTRRLHRNGDSEYFINKQPTRLKDIQSMFMGSGIGKDGFSIFEQGKIDEIINLSPTDRRAIFEDAAGIGRFLMRKAEAKKKLDQTEQNLIRLKDIDKEVEKQLNILEKQSEKARTFKDRKTFFETLEKSVLVGKWEAWQKKLQDTQAKSQELQLKIDDLNQAIENLQNNQHDSKTDVAQTEVALKSKQEELYTIKSGKEIKQKELQTFSERFQEAKEKEQLLKLQLEEIKKRRIDLKDEFQEGEKKQKVLEKELSLWEEKLHFQRENTLQLDTELAKLREQQFKAQQERMKAFHTENAIDSELKQAKIRLEGFQERSEQLKARQKDLVRLIAECDKHSQEKKVQMAAVSKSIDEQKSQLRHQENQLKEMAQELNKKQAELDILRKEITEAKARQKVLWRLREEMQGFSAGSKKLLQDSQKQQSPIYKKVQPIYELLKVDSGREAALSAAMRPYLQTLVVKTHQDLEAVIQYAEQQKIKDFSVFCLESIQKSSAPKDLPKEYQSLVKSNSNPITLHFLSAVVEAENLQKGLENKTNAIEVYAPGLYIDRQHVIFFSIQSEGNVFTREAELKSLETSIEQNEKTAARFESLLNEVQQKKQNAHNDLAEHDKSIRKEEMKLVEVNFTLQKALGDLEKAKQEQKQFDSEWQSTQENITKWKHEVDTGTEKLAAAKKKNAETLQASTKLDELYEQQQVAFKIKSKEQRDQETSYQKLLEQHQKLVYQVNLVTVRDQESHAQEQKSAIEITESIALQQKMIQLQQETTKLLKDCEGQLKTVQKEFQEIENQVTKKKSSLESSDQQANKHRNELKKLEADHYQLGNQLGQQTSSITVLEAEIQERYHLTIQEALEKGFKPEKTVQETEKQLRELRKELEEMGDVNMTAIEECEQHRQRHEFLFSQIGDLDGSKAELLAIINELDEECRKLFTVTFEAIRLNFQKNFKILFNGGEADLQFTESNDILTAGVEIIAKPPGKQMRSITLLSGGEKCMTAMALLFAVFEVKPAPFCILDEMDAPLDDSNIERFVNVLKQFLDRCQFIIITHNKRTMAIADVLYGVSMEEKGVSKILSMEFDKSCEPSLVL
jgi:chromosome segregation protein